MQHVKKKSTAVPSSSEGAGGGRAEIGLMSGLGVTRGEAGGRGATGRAAGTTSASRVGVAAGAAAAATGAAAVATAAAAAVRRLGDRECCKEHVTLAYAAVWALRPARPWRDGSIELACT